MDTKRIIAAIAAVTLAAGLSACHSGKKPDTESTVHETVGDTAALDREAGSKIGVTQESTENVSGLPEDLYACKIELNGSILTLPCKISDLEALGFSLPESVRNNAIEGGRYTGTSVSSEAGDHILIALYNTGDSDRTAEQCEVYEMTVFLAATTKDMDISIAKGITFGFTMEQIREIYGEPISEYTSGTNDTIMKYRAQGCMIEFGFLSNSLVNIHLQLDAV